MKKTDHQTERGTAMFSASEHKPEIIVFVAAFSAFLATFNETFLNVAFSPIMADLEVGVSTVQWLATAYMLGAAIMVPVSAFLYRSVPTKRLYLITVSLLVVGSVIGALAMNFPMLLVGRIVQALGTGMLIPIGMNITLEVAPRPKLGTYMGIMGAMTTLGPSLSVIVAGVLLAFFNWQMLLWVFAALSGICFICGACLLGNVADLKHPKLDVTSTTLISIALIGILYGVSTIFSDNISIALLAFVVGILFLIAFIARQKNLSEPLIDLRPLSVKPFAVGVIINMISLVVIFALNIVMPLFLQSALEASALDASLTLFPAILLSCVVSPIAGRVYDRDGAKTLLPLGFALICICTVALAFVHDTGSLVLLAILYIPVICGSALIIGPVQSLALSHLTPELNPHGITVMSTGFQIAGCLGSSLFSGVYSLSAAASNGFTTSCLLGTLFALAGFFLSMYVRRLSKRWETGRAPARSLMTVGIASVMKYDAYCVPVHATVLDALRCMTDNKTSGLPVVAADGYIAGFISNGDIVRFMFGKDSENSDFASIYPLWHNSKVLDERLSELNRINVMEFATRKIVAVELSDDIEALFNAFSDRRIKKVPVHEAGKMVGTVSRSDLMRQLITNSPLLEQ
ncbi:MAG: arabinose efflux permease family protein [Firmicutes bacterium]|nr:arabinose efflux permease family protein [Bacillota bacterium]